MFPLGLRSGLSCGRLAFLTFMINTLIPTHINQVKGIVRQNINKVVERGERLDDLGDKAGMT